MDKDPGNSGPDQWAEDNDVDLDLSESSGMAAGSNVRSADSDGDRDADADDPERQAILVNRDPVDMDDDDAVLRALQEGDRDRLDPGALSLEDRMRFGLLTKRDDIARVEGKLGDYVATGQDNDVRGAGRTNIYDNKPGDNEGVSPDREDG